MTTTGADRIDGATCAFDRVELPPLQAPTGALMLGGGMGGGGRESNEAYIRLETQVHSIALAAHFAKQLASAGWTITGPTLGQGIVIYGARRRDGEDRMLGGLLYTLREISEGDARFRGFLNADVAEYVSSQSTRTTRDEGLSSLLAVPVPAPRRGGSGRMRVGTTSLGRRQSS